MVLLHVLHQTHQPLVTGLGVENRQTFLFRNINRIFSAIFFHNRRKVDDEEAKLAEQVHGVLGMILRPGGHVDETGLIAGHDVFPFGAVAYPLLFIGQTVVRHDDDALKLGEQVRDVEGHLGCFGPVVPGAMARWPFGIPEVLDVQFFRGRDPLEQRSHDGLTESLLHRVFAEELPLHHPAIPDEVVLHAKAMADLIVQLLAVQTLLQLRTDFLRISQIIIRQSCERVDLVDFQAVAALERTAAEFVGQQVFREEDAIFLALGPESIKGFLVLFEQFGLEDFGAGLDEVHDALHQAAKRLDGGLGVREAFPARCDRDAVRGCLHDENEVIFLIIVPTPVRDILHELQEFIVDARVFLIRLDRIDDVAVPQGELGIHATGPAIGQEQVVLRRRDRDGGDGLPVQDDIHLAKGGDVLSNLDEQVGIRLVLHRDDDLDAFFRSGHGHHDTPIRLALCEGRATADGMDSLETVMAVDHREVVRIGERGLAAEAEATGLVAVVLLGGVAIDAVNLVDQGMGNAEASILDGQLVLIDIDDDRLVPAIRHDVGVPSVAEHLTDDGQRLVGIQRVGQDREEFSGLGNSEFLDVLTADDRMGIIIVSVGDLHRFLLWFSEFGTSASSVLTDYFPPTCTHGQENADPLSLPIGPWAGMEGRFFRWFAHVMA